MFLCKKILYYDNFWTMLLRFFYHFRIVFVIFYTPFGDAMWTLLLCKMPIWYLYFDYQIYYTIF